VPGANAPAEAARARNVRAEVRSCIVFVVFFRVTELRYYEKVLLSVRIDKISDSLAESLSQTGS
jgi:hypothetical protein